jgi:two-component system response regulator AtoC
MIQIAIIDDEKVLVNSLEIAFKDKYDVKCFYNGKDFIVSMEEISPDVVLLDIRLPDYNGIDILKTIKEQFTNTNVIMITAHGEINIAIEAMKSGAFDFINKPFDLNEMLITVEKAINDIKLKNEINHLRAKNIYNSAFSIIGESKKIKELTEMIKKISKIADCNILIRGESGTGKELVAKEIHKLGAGEDKPFIDINCSAFPEHLLESELFGYEKGAFTDAKNKKRGLIELADGGTLFLDEIGEMPVNLQAKLLRFIETRKFRRLGGNKEIEVKLKLISATNKNLEESIKNKSFRQDLFYRLNVLEIVVPPLRERDNDILILSNYFVDYFSKKFGRKSVKLDEKTVNLFKEYHWPGNVRELKNLIERLVIMSSSDVITSEQLPVEISKKTFNPVHSPINLENQDFNLDMYLEKIEYQLIRQALIKTKGVKTEAAELLGISRHSLKRRLLRLKQHYEDFL